VWFLAPASEPRGFDGRCQWTGTARAGRLAGTVDEDPQRLVRNAARTLVGRFTAFDATISAIAVDDAVAASAVGAGGTAETDTVAAPVKAPQLGPRTLDVRKLPLISTSATEAGADLEVTRTLGEGGMGIVELARQHSLQRDVALKRLKPGVRDAARIWALLQEAAFTGYVEHPGIVPVHAVGRDEHGLPVMVMKRVEGVTLLTMLRDDGHPAWARANGDRVGLFIQVIRRLCEALSSAHARGVVHRDVKPENVMLGSFGEVLLLDWGVAVRAGEALTSIAGTPAYMAPEMLAIATAPLDARTDVFLLGATLHECLTGAPPHAGDTLDEVITSIAFSAPRAYGADVPEELAGILRRAMHRSPGERFPDTIELGRALETFERHRASAELADAAQARLVELEARLAAEPDADDIDALFHACRFGFEHAQRGYPDNPVAAAGLRRALVAMVGHELRRRNATSATNLLTSLAALSPGEAPDPSLAERLEELRRELASEHAAQARLVRIERDLDVSVASRERAIGLRIAGTLAILTTIVVTSGRAAGLFDPSTNLLAVISLPGSVVLATTLYAFRRRLFGNRASRQIGFTMLSLFVAILTHRLLGAARGWALGDVMSGDAFIISTIAAVSALTLRRVLFVPAALFWIAGVVSPFLESFSFLPTLGAGITSAGILILAPKRFEKPALGDHAA
jgi:eukaryotic-like serine/threonine-protein kinase